MAKLDPMTDADFEHKGGQYFDSGVHEVIITKAETGQSKTGTPFIGFTVEGTEGQTTDVRLYLSEKAAPYTRSKLATIAVHNQTDEAGKEKARAAFKAITDTDQLIEPKFVQRFVDMQAWIDTYEDENAPNPNGGFYKRSDLFGYEPKHREPTGAVQQMLKESEPVDPNEIPF